MTAPGPPALVWGVELLLFAAAVVPAGELFRRLAARWVGLFRNLGPVERLLLDLYLGGGGLYVVASVPLGLFSLPGVLAYLAVTIAACAGWVAWDRRRTAGSVRPRWRPTLRLAPLLVLAATLGLYAVEVAVAQAQPVGNTYDTSLLVDYASLLLRHHQLGLSLAPIAPELTSYPQGATVWIAAAQLLFHLPPARAPLLVTPLFLSLGPLAGYVWGRRLLGSPWAGAAVGLVFALVGSWTRVEVATSNDFVMSFPLVLWLLARVDVWAGSGPRWGDAVAFGAVAGYSAALNPVGAEWLFLIVVLFAALGVRRASLRAAARWVGRWLAAGAATLAFILPSLWVLSVGRGNPTPLTGAVSLLPRVGAPGLSASQFIGSVDPFLFGPSDVWLSPFPALRAELAVLLVAGAVVLLVPSGFERLGPAGVGFRRMVAAAVAAAAGWLGMLVASRSGVPGFAEVARVASGAELSIYLFTAYTLLAAVPLVLVLHWAASRSPARAGAEPRGRPPSAGRAVRPSGHPERAVAIALAVALVLPGAIVTGTDFPTYVRDLYSDFGRLGPADFALFSWATAHLPTGARVLVAPGSSAQFLPGYVDVTLLYPVLRVASNASYVELDRELVNGTLTSAGLADLRVLAVQYIVVTGNNTDLWAPFSPLPLLAAGPTEFPVDFEEPPVYVFGVND